MLMTATSRPSRSMGERLAGAEAGSAPPTAAAPAGSGSAAAPARAGTGSTAAARACPISQIPFTPRTAPTYSNTTASNIAIAPHTVGADRDLRRQCPDSTHEGVGEV